MGVKGKDHILLLFCLPIILSQHVAVVNCSQHTETTTTAPTATQTPDNWYTNSYFYYRTSNEWIQIVGNDKEVDIEENLDNLMVIGNNNTIRIQTNDGHIKYTGNGGQICLGEGSKQQMADLFGNGNVLEVGSC